MVLQTGRHRPGVAAAFFGGGLAAGTKKRAWHFLHWMALPRADLGTCEMSLQRGQRTPMPAGAPGGGLNGGGDFLDGFLDAGGDEDLGVCVRRGWLRTGGRLRLGGDADDFCAAAAAFTPVAPR